METILFVILAFALLYVVITIILEQSKSKRKKALINKRSKTSQSKPAQARPSSQERSIESREKSDIADRIHFVTGKDSVNGLDACYYLLVDESKVEKFKEDSQSQTMNLLDYGEIIASCYGKTPNERVRNILKEQYDVILDDNGIAASANHIDYPDESQKTDRAHLAPVLGSKPTNRPNSIDYPDEPPLDFPPILPPGQGPVISTEERMKMDKMIKEARIKYDEWSTNKSKGE